MSKRGSQGVCIKEPESLFEMRTFRPHNCRPNQVNILYKWITAVHHFWITVLIHFDNDEALPRSIALEKGTWWCKILYRKSRVCKQKSLSKAWNWVLIHTIATQVAPPREPFVPSQPKAKSGKSHDQPRQWGWIYFPGSVHLFFHGAD